MADLRVLGAGQMRIETSLAENRLFTASSLPIFPCPRKSHLCLGGVTRIFGPWQVVLSAVLLGRITSFHSCRTTSPKPSNFHVARRVQAIRSASARLQTCPAAQPTSSFLGPATDEVHSLRWLSGTEVCQGRSFKPLLRPLRDQKCPCPVKYWQGPG